jgi:hypothetical protein
VNKNLNCGDKLGCGRRSWPMDSTGGEVAVVVVGQGNGGGQNVQRSHSPPHQQQQQQHDLDE